MAQTLGPLDDYDCLFILQDLIEVDSIRRSRACFQTIEIDVVEKQSTLMGIDQRKRRTGNLFFIQANGVRDTLHQDGFACAQWAVEENDFATRKRRTDTGAKVESLAFGFRNEFPSENW